MGYTTDFSGEFKLDRPLSPEHKAYLCQFMETRRMKRDAAVTETRPDPLRLAVGLPIGEEGGYFVGAEGMAGQEWNADDVLDGNTAPAGQPGLWCQWTPDDAGECIEWNGGEKFYNYVEWLEYLVQHFLSVWGYVLNGTVEWQGEDSRDIGRIVVENNVVHVEEGVVSFVRRA